jgi:undecaprenyl diphosphate synthase
MENGLHIAIIPDGNRRWARQNNKSVPEGHAAGIEKLKDVVQWCKELGIRTLSVWIFSTENASRSKEEVGALFKLFEEMLNKLESHKDFDKLRKEVELRFVGNLSIFPNRLIERIKKIEHLTEKNKEYKLVILAGYGGRQEIIDAANKIAADAKAGKAKRIDEETFRSYLYAPDIPDPDLIFRSADEQRLSGLLPWQSVYSEFYFCKKLWPDVTKEDFANAITEFRNRQRRFGK